MISSKPRRPGGGVVAKQAVRAERRHTGGHCESSSSAIANVLKETYKDFKIRPRANPYKLDLTLNLKKGKIMLDLLWTKNYYILDLQNYSSGSLIVGLILGDISVVRSQIQVILEPLCSWRWELHIYRVGGY